MCIDDIKLGLGRCVASTRERAAYSVNHMYLLVISICNFGCFFLGICF